MSDVQEIEFPKDHNGGPIVDPEKHKELDNRVTKFTEAAGIWLDHGEIKDDEQAGKLSDFIDGAKALHKVVEARRKDAKKPYDDAGKAVQKLFLPMADRIDFSLDKVKPALAKYLADKAEKQREAERIEAERLEAERIEAEKQAARAEASNDVAGQAEAAEKTKEIEKQAAKAPAKTQVRSASGGGRTKSLTTMRTAVLSNFPMAVSHYKDKAELRDLLVRLANADIRASKGQAITIPGFEIKAEEVLR